MQPFQGIDRSEWSIRDFILEGSQITWETQETEVRQSREPFVVADVHDHFLIWYFSLKDFLFKQGYLDETHPAFSQAASLIEAGKVPRIRESAIEISGIGYGDPRSEKSQKLLKDVRDETSSILKSLSKMVSSVATKSTELRGRSLRFDGRSATIFINDTPVSLKKALIQASIARAMFSHGKIGTKIHWKTIAAKPASGGTKETIKGATRGINLKVQKVVKVNDELLTWKDGFVVRNL